MKLKEVKEQLSAIGVAIKVVERTEYRIVRKDGNEDSAYYTADLEDALDTGKAMVVNRELHDENGVNTGNSFNTPPIN